MTDNIKPEHYRTGEIDLYEAWYRTYPFNEYRAIMQAVAERYMRRDKNDRVEDLGKAIYTLERLKEKEIEHLKGKENERYVGTTYSNGGPVFKSEIPIGPIAGIYKGVKHIGRYLLLHQLERDGYKYLARDENGELYAFKGTPKKHDDMDFWDTGANDDSLIKQDNFPEVKWTDEEPTKISELLASYENGGENGKVED